MLAHIFLVKLNSFYEINNCKYVYIVCNIESRE